MALIYDGRSWKFNIEELQRKIDIQMVVLLHNSLIHLECLMKSTETQQIPIIKAPRKDPQE